VKILEVHLGGVLGGVLEVEKVEEKRLKNLKYYLSFSI